MTKTIHSVFPSSIYVGKLNHQISKNLNKHLKRESYVLSEIDEEGIKWSSDNYENGYSSYASLTHLHKTSPYFAELEMRLKPHVQKMIRHLQWNLMGKKVEMTTCWTNIMGMGAHHTLHIHPYSVLSGVYYVEAPKGSCPIKFEDPRMDSFMAAPPRKADAPFGTQPYIHFPPIAGQFILFESWMRHEVTPHLIDKERISVSFNFEWV